LQKSLARRMSSLTKTAPTCSPCTILIMRLGGCGMR